MVIFQNEESEESPVVSLEAITEPEQQLVAKSETPTQDSVPPANLLGTEATEIAKGGHVNTTNATIIGDSNDTESEESPAVPLEAITEPEQQSVAKPKTPTQGSVPPVNLLGTEATEIAEGGHVNTTNATIIGDSNDTESEKSPVVSLNNTEPEQRPPADPEMLPVGIPPVNALDDEATLEGNKTRPVNTTIIRDSDSVATEKEAEGDSYILPFAVGLGVGTIIKAAPSFRASTDKSDPHSSSLSSPSSPAPAPVLPPPLIPPSKTSSSATDDLDDKTTPIHEHTSGDSPTMPPLSDIALEDFNDIARDIIEKAKVSEGKRKMEIYKHSKTIHGRSTLYHETRRDGSDINCFDMLESSTQRFLVLAQTAENALARHQIDSIEAKRIALGISAKTEKEAEAHISCLPDEIKYPNGKGNMQHPFKCSTFINPNNKTIIKIEILDPKLYSANGTESIKDTRLIELKENQVFYDIICKINEKGLGNFLQECNQGRACTP